MRKQLNWIKDRYNNVPVYVTENGVSDRNGSLVDIHRIDYYRAYINEVLKGRILIEQKKNNHFPSKTKTIYLMLYE